MAVRPMITRFHCVSALCSILLVIFVSVGLCDAAEKIVATIQVMDALTVPGQPVAIDAQLEINGVSKNVGLGGEPLELVVDGKVAETATTGGDGRASFSYSTKTVGVLP